MQTNAARFKVGQRWTYNPSGRVFEIAEITKPRSAKELIMKCGAVIPLMVMNKWLDDGDIREYINAESD